MVGMSSFDEVFAALRSHEDNSTRGTLFEKLMVRYFKLHPTLSQEYDRVCRWVDWEYNGNTGDTGIDLVAHRVDDDSWTAIQCKFYDPNTTLQKNGIDSFLSASGSTFRVDGVPVSFSNRIIISTTDRWGKNAEAAIENQTIPVQRFGLAEIAEAPIEWDVAYPDADNTPIISLDLRKRFEPRPHQQQAIDKVLDGFKAHDRGKLIMACGTGKTFTSLKLAEAYAARLSPDAPKARILFCVPSISLLSQSLREWTTHCQLDLRAFAVCSDNKVSRAAEDIASYELEIPVTTDGKELAEKLQFRRRAAGLTVVFSTYQSLPAIHEAQQAGGGEFDLIICDEAHRTTGVTLAGEDPSNFVVIHDNSYIKAAKRLYMTATPRLFDEQIKDKAAEHSAEIASMDDEAIYGPELHRLGFSEAVDKGLLTDYKVVVLTVDQDAAAATTQRVIYDNDYEVALDDVSRLIGCWNGLSKRSGVAQDSRQGFEANAKPMQRAVAFAKDIKSSKAVADVLPKVCDTYSTELKEKSVTNPDIDPLNLDLSVAADHVDGSMNALTRGKLLQWLKAPVPENECRVLSNARCLSEGVDVPALDAVIFLNPRNSVVDVVQSVGRVMRKAEGKDYGYIILPIGIPEGVSPDQALADNKRFKVVWQVLNALRAHDDRFNAMVNSANLNTKDIGDQITGDAPAGGGGKKDSSGGVSADEGLRQKLAVTHISKEEDPSDTPGDEDTTQLVLFGLEQWQEAIYTRIVDKVGERTYWEDWADDVATMAQAQITRINELLDHADEKLLVEFEKFVEGLRGNLNDSVTRDDAISMLSQHMITAPVFDALFAEHDFAAHNPVSVVMQTMVDALSDKKLESETAGLEKFYDSVRVRASEVTSAAGKQQVIRELYERFFQKAFRKQAEALGIVYTPVEIVDYILRAADYVSREHFGRGLTDENVHILDPFTGTGTFMVRLLQSGLIEPHDLARKYASELHATEIMLLAYYVAAVNIETTYHALEKERALREEQPEPGYVPFDGIALADTFQVYEEDDQLDLDVFTTNNERIEKQKNTPIHIIVGNPPYSVGQASANDLNANMKYPSLDHRIETSYADKSSATNKNSLYDSYLRAFRWATDRVTEGVVGFVTNGGWLYGNTADGVRLTFAEDYSDIYVFNLRGNQRTAGELSRREGGKVFGSGSRASVAIFVGVRTPGATGCRIHYRDIGDYLSAKEKLEIVDKSTIDNTPWETIVPNQYGDWINQRSDKFHTWPVLGNKKSGPNKSTFFETFSLGLGTNRDAWVYNFSLPTLHASVTKLIIHYEKAREAYQASEYAIGDSKEQDVTAFLKSQTEHAAEQKIKWSRSLRQYAAKNRFVAEHVEGYRASLYRPFCKQNVYFDRALNHERGQLPRIFPTPKHDNVGFSVMGPRDAATFAVLATDLLPDVALFVYAVQFFSRWTWEPVVPEDGALDLSSGTQLDAGAGCEGEVVDGYRRVDNITDEIHQEYCETLGADVTKDEIFYFVYGQLHDPGYREAYAADLKKMLPHIETPTDIDRFRLVSKAGRELMDLHINYEDVEPWPVDVQLKPGTDASDRETWRVTKMKWNKVRDPETKKMVEDRSTIIYNPKVTITGIPLEADEYQLGSRSALAWIIDRYRYTKDKKSGIINDPNDWADEVGNPRYIVDLIGKVTRVAMETNRIINTIDSRN